MQVTVARRLSKFSLTGALPGGRQVGQVGGHVRKGMLIGYLKREASTLCQLGLPIHHTREPFTGKKRGDFHGLLRFTVG